LILLIGHDIIVSGGGGFFEPPLEWCPIVGEICKNRGKMGFQIERPGLMWPFQARAIGDRKEVV
jgi:hypothetical protein